jgi:hypothetical protein
MAVLAGYRIWKKDGESLPDYLDQKVFSDAKSVELMASKEDIEGFNRFLAQYQKALPMEVCALKVMK